MFHLYFGAFDIVLYLGATYFAAVLAKAICDDLEQPRGTQATAAMPLTAASRPVVPVAKREDVQERVTVKVNG
ncbi:MAG: hypothetical protein F6J95_024190 [Leptolyngbya sp. SIO1E4]|nr:hypothetical protein [Leptolyngbya sp. SIO1E4]